jgi:hypothetical protein
VSRATLSLDNSHEGLAFTLSLPKWLTIAHVLVLWDFGFLKAKVLASSEVGKGKRTVEGYLATRCDHFAGSLCILLSRLRRFRVAMAPCSDSSLQGPISLDD